MADALLAKLSYFTRLSPDDTRAVRKLCRGRVESYAARQDITVEGDRPTHVRLLVTGWAFRYKMMPDGRRQIISIFLPGDLCDLNVFVLREMDHSIGTLTAATVAEIPGELFDELDSSFPRVMRALQWESLVTSAIQREWALNLGQRTAVERLAHLFCELFMRLQAVGMTTHNSYEMPVTQIELAETTGMSTVHVNRSLQSLRENGLIELRSRRLVIPDMAALRRAGVFNPNYLHLDHEGRGLDASDNDFKN